jgi:hypothetical protein
MPVKVEQTKLSALADLNTLRATRIAGFVPGTETGTALIMQLHWKGERNLLVKDIVGLI